MGRHHEQTALIRQAVEVANRLAVSQGGPELALDDDMAGVTEFAHDVRASLDTAFHDLGPVREALGYLGAALVQHAPQRLLAGDGGGQEMAQGLRGPTLALIPAKPPRQFREDRRRARRIHA